MKGQKKEMIERNIKSMQAKPKTSKYLPSRPVATEKNQNPNVIQTPQKSVQTQNQTQQKVAQQQSQTQISEKKEMMANSPSMEKINIIGLSKLNGMLADSGVQTIECPGPGKQILVCKSGVIQTTNFSLTLEEINKIMKEISEKTRIPLMSGVFKAAWDNYIITAVMSEFVGTRFIINKKAPQ